METIQEENMVGVRCFAGRFTQSIFVSHLFSNLVQRAVVECRGYHCSFEMGTCSRSFFGRLLACKSADVVIGFIAESVFRVQFNYLPTTLDLTLPKRKYLNNIVFGIKRKPTRHKAIQLHLQWPISALEKEPRLLYLLAMHCMK